MTLTDFDSATKNLLAVTRFPAYYAFGFTLVAIAVASSIALLKFEKNARRRNIVILSLTGLALILMCGDYQVIYKPLETMMLEPEGRLSAEFFTYHQWSKYINSFSILACLIAGFVSAWPLQTAAINDSKNARD